MMFNGEKNKTLWVLLEQWLVGFLWFDSGCNSGFAFEFDFLGQIKLGDALDWDWDILLVDRGEVNHLSRRVAHLEACDASCSL
jgi:hypothetical protein